jgi:hypothetical protein
MTNRLHQKLVIDVIEQTPDIKLQHPIVPPAALAGYRQCLVC